MDTTRGFWFWARRYGPAEVVCLATMLVASSIATGLTDSPALLAASAIAGATVGFYGVLVTMVTREQLDLVARGEPRRRLAVSGRVVVLLLGEFGLAEVLDTFAVRPALMIAGVALVGAPVWGLLAGKVVADLLFYVISGIGYRLTEMTGLRARRACRDSVVSHI